MEMRKKCGGGYRGRRQNRVLPSAESSVCPIDGVRQGSDSVTASVGHVPVARGPFRATRSACRGRGADGGFYWEIESSEKNPTKTGSGYDADVGRKIHCGKKNNADASPTANRDLRQRKIGHGETWSSFDSLSGYLSGGVVEASRTGDLTFGSRPHWRRNLEIGTWIWIVIVISRC